jgi:hypothetical protein
VDHGGHVLLLLSEQDTSTAARTFDCWLACASHMKSSQRPACTLERLRSKRAGGKTGRRRRWWWRVLIDHEMHTQRRRRDTSALRASGTRLLAATAKGVSSSSQDKTRRRQSSSMLSRCHHHLTISPQPPSPIAAGQWFTGAARSRLSTAKSC